MTVYIYALCCPTTGEIRYVGKTTNLKMRFRHHCCDKVQTHKSRWIQSLRASGFLPLVEALEVIENSDDCDWQESERFWISYLRFLGFRLTNLDSGGSAGKCPSAETRKKMSAAHVGRAPSKATLAALLAANIGRKMKPEWIAKQRASRGVLIHSEGTRMKMRLSHLGKCHSPEVKAKISAAQKGRTFSAETIEKMRAAKLGTRHTDSAKAKVSAATKGRILSEEHKRKIGAAHLGKKRSAVASANMSAGQKARFAKARAITRSQDLAAAVPRSE